MGRRDTDLPLCPQARARQVVRAGSRPVFERILQTLQELAGRHGAQRLTLDVGDIVRATQRRFSQYTRPLVGEVFDALDFLTAAGRIQRSWNAQGQVVIRVMDTQKGGNDD